MQKPKPARRVTPENFNEADYLESNPDVAEAVAAGVIGSGREHFERYGVHEGRRSRPALGMAGLRAAKMARLSELLDLSLPHRCVGEKFDFLTEELRAQAGIAETDNVASNAYDAQTQALIKRHENGLVLDCGAGRRQVYYGNVVNFEIVDYETTDVIGVGERLPFKDNAFDAIISLAVLEHVRDPFACAREMVRVLKPGGELLCGVPFLQPQHGYPGHYYNMAPQGLRALFERDLEIIDHQVVESALPVWSLAWIVQSWAAGLSGGARDAFLSMRLGDLMEAPHRLLNRDWVRELLPEKNMELASGTLLTARKPALRKRAAKKPVKKAAPRAKSVSSGGSAKPPSPRAPARRVRCAGRAWSGCPCRRRPIPGAPVHP
jgi:SAM-dependent methyltransferase